MLPSQKINQVCGKSWWFNKPILQTRAAVAILASDVRMSGLRKFCYSATDTQSDWLIDSVQYCIVLYRSWTIPPDGAPLVRMRIFKRRGGADTMDPQLTGLRFDQVWRLLKPIDCTALLWWTAVRPVLYWSSPTYIEQSLLIRVYSEFVSRLPCPGRFINIFDWIFTRPHHYFHIFPFNWQLSRGEERLAGGDCWPVQSVLSSLLSSARNIYPSICCSGRLEEKLPSVRTVTVVKTAELITIIIFPFQWAENGKCGPNCPIYQ